MTNKTFVSFDLDDVLTPFCETLMEELRRQTGRVVPFDRLQDYHTWHEHYDLNEFPDDIVINQKILERCPVHPHAQEVISRLKDDGRQIMIVTARAWHPRGFDITENWLKKQKLDVDMIHVVQHGLGKQAIFDRTPNIIGHIDDAPAYVDAAQQHRHIRHAVVMDRPWNQHMDTNGHTLHRVDCLTQFAQLILNQEH